MSLPFEIGRKGKHWRECRWGWLQKIQWHRIAERRGNRESCSHNGVIQPPHKQLIQFHAWCPQKLWDVENKHWHHNQPTLSLLKECVSSSLRVAYSLKRLIVASHAIAKITLLIFAFWWSRRWNLGFYLFLFQLFVHPSIVLFHKKRNHLWILLLKLQKVAYSYQSYPIYYT